MPASARSTTGLRTRSPGAAARKAVVVCATSPAKGANQNHTMGAARLTRSAVAASMIVLPDAVGASNRKQPIRRAIRRRSFGAR